MKIGDIEITVVNDGEGKLPSSYIPKLDWKAHDSLLDAEGNFAIALGCFLVRSKDTTILVDAGLGPVNFPPFRGGDLPGNLAAAGVRPDGIDLVLITHLHLDHIGWLAQNGEPYFRNATIRFGERDLDQFVRREDPDPMTAPVVKVLEETGRIDTVTGQTSIEAASILDTDVNSGICRSSFPRGRSARSCSATRSPVRHSWRTRSGRRCPTSTRACRRGRGKRCTASSREATT